MHPSFQHITTGCKVALMQGWYRLHHNQVLHTLAEEHRSEANSTTPPSTEPQSCFIRRGTERETMVCGMC